MAVASKPEWRKQVRDTWTRSGHGWAKWESVLLHNLTSVNPYLIRALHLKPGHHVLDFGCGLGEPALTIAPFVGERGTVLGVDLARSMVQTARLRARALRARNVRFRITDVAHLPATEGQFNAVTARYGIMFPESPESVLAALRGRMKRGGRIALAVWGKPSRNAYFAIARRVFVPLLDAPPPDPENSPHPMRFHRSGKLADLLRKVGFRKVTQESVESPFVFESSRQCVEVMHDSSASTRVVLDALSSRRQAQVLRQLQAAVARYEANGVIRMPGHAWVVSGTR